MPEVVTCPHCEKKARVPDELLGQKVKCPGCGNTFTAEAPKRSSAPPPDEEEETPRRREPPKESGYEAGDKPEKRRRSRRDDDDDEDDDEDRDDDKPRRRRKRFDEDDDDGLDRPRRRRVRDQGPSGFGIASLILGIISLPLGFCCGLFSLPVSVLAIIFGGVGINRPGRGMAIAGLVMGLIAILLAIVMVIIGISMGSLRNIH